MLVIGGIGSAFDGGESTNSSSDDGTEVVAEAGNLPGIDTKGYEGKEGLLVYKELKGKGYAVDAEFNNPALTDVNGKASTLFESLDPNKADDRQSVDGFVVGSAVQAGDSVKLTVILKPN